MMNNQVFVLTGCASGIGKHLAAVLIKRGSCLIATDINTEGLKHLSGDNVITHQLDVRDPAQRQTVIDLAVEKWGGSMC